MLKQDVIGKMAEFAEGTKVDAERYLEAFLRVLEYAIENDENVKLVGHFIQEVVPTRPRMGRNPHTREEVPIPAGRKIRIRPGKILKDLV